MSHSDLSTTRRRLLGATIGGRRSGSCRRLIGSSNAADQRIQDRSSHRTQRTRIAVRPTQRASAELATDEINKAGGILGRQIKLLPTDGGGPPAETAKSVVRLLLEEKVDLIIGSHDSATREALVTTIKGKVPYIYTPVYEGGECAFNTYVIADTPEQQIRPSITWLMQERGVKSFYMIGNDYVWPHKSNDHAKKYIAENGGKVIGEEYVPLGAPNKFEEVVTRIKSAKPDAVLITVIGADNVNFNRTFAGFGLDKDIARLSLLARGEHAQGHRRGEQQQSLLLHVLFRQYSDRRQQEIQGGLCCEIRRQGTSAQHHRRRLLRRRELRQGLVEKAGGNNAQKCMAASKDLGFESASGHMTMYGQHVDKNMFLADCKGTEFDILKTFETGEARRGV